MEFSCQAPIVCFITTKNYFLFIFHTFLQLTTRSFTIITMHFTVVDNGTQWILDFDPDSVVLSVKDLDENFTISSLEVPLAAWSSLLSQRQKFLNNHLPQVTITPTQQRRSTLQCWSTKYRHEGIRAVRSRRHWIQLGRSCSGYGQCLPICKWYPIFPIRPWRFSDGEIKRCQPNNSLRWGRQGEFSSNNNNTRVWASNRTPPITEMSSIRDLTVKCAWLPIQDSLPLNFVFETLYVFSTNK